MFAGSNADAFAVWSHMHLRMCLQNVFAVLVVDAFVPLVLHAHAGAFGDAFARNVCKTSFVGAFVAQVSLAFIDAFIDAFADEFAKHACKTTF